ncbi:MAG: hypothetical protein AUF73_00710 [Thaumarchaeota archaeon 13_1_20CM_2_39_11]|nr:MAG: hypothetical protein AUF73_00710 [Thaumarchaeota archaeon 13_1_20CM_2_39_11]
MEERKASLMSSRIVTRFAFTLIVLILLFPTLQYALAIPGFQENDFKLTQRPVVCAIEPNDTRFPNLANTAMDQTSYAITDWQLKLNEGLGKHPVWKIDLVKLPSNIDKLPDTCNIAMIFLPQPENESDYGLLGYTVHNKTAGTAGIAIYYMKFELTWQRDTEGNIVYEQPIVYYSPNIVAPDSTFGATIRHELGHAFGLGHYTVSEEEVHRYAQGDAVPPSIMVPSEHEYPLHYQITPLDVREIKEKYGLDGFPVQSAPPQTVRANSNAQGSQAIQSSIVIPSWIKNNAKWWSQGAVSDDDFIKGIQYLIKNGIMKIPYGQSSASPSHQIPVWVKNNAAWWASDQISDDDFVKGIQYLISNGIIVA